MNATAQPAPPRRSLRIAHADIGSHRVRYAVRPGDPDRPPLLFFNGIGANIELALPFIDALTGPTVVIFDVPGVGDSPTPTSPYRPSNIARLAAALLDRLEFAEADVLGVSWGGMIAQQFALQYRARCRRLILAATTPGALMVPGRPWVLLKMVTPRRYHDKAHALRIAGAIYGGAFRRDPDLVSTTFRHVRFASKGGYYLQLAAGWGWTSLPWLFMLRQPTLVMAGTDDPLLPLVNARILHCLIPNARLELLDCGHLFLVTRPAKSARIVESFLTEPATVARPRRRRAGTSPLRSSRRTS